MVIAAGIQDRLNSFGIIVRNKAYEEIICFFFIGLVPQILPILKVWETLLHRDSKRRQTLREKVCVCLCVSVADSMLLIFVNERG